jgi:hypothetical protein
MYEEKIFLWFAKETLYMAAPSLSLTTTLKIDSKSEGSKKRGKEGKEKKASLSLSLFD